MTASDSPSAHILSLERHYSRSDLIINIERKLANLGKNISTVSLNDFTHMEEFHIGGRKVTQMVLEQLRPVASDHLIDIGCGIGGAARFAARTFGCRVTGIDLSVDFIETGNRINRWLRLNRLIELKVANILQDYNVAHCYDKALMLHVGMNVEDKSKLFANIKYLLRSGGVLALYDVVRTAPGELRLPLPWASRVTDNHISTMQEYLQAADYAGLELLSLQPDNGFALNLLAGLQRKISAGKGECELGLHLLMGEDAGEKVENMSSAIRAGIIAPLMILLKA